MKQLWAVGVREFVPGYFRIRVERLREGQNSFDMAGTEGTHAYTVHATVMADEQKIAKLLTREAGWKQPGDSGQDRFSTVTGKSELEQKLGFALRAVGYVKAEHQVNPDAVTVGTKLGVNAHGQTAAATVSNRLAKLAKLAKTNRRKKPSVSV